MEEYVYPPSMKCDYTARALLGLAIVLGGAVPLVIWAVLRLAWEAQEGGPLQG